MNVPAVGSNFEIDGYKSVQVTGDPQKDAKNFADANGISVEVAKSVLQSNYGAPKAETSSSNTTSIVTDSKDEESSIVIDTSSSTKSTTSSESTSSTTKKSSESTTSNSTDDSSSKTYTSKQKTALSAIERAKGALKNAQAVRNKKQVNTAMIRLAQTITNAKKLGLTSSDWS